MTQSILNYKLFFFSFLILLLSCKKKESSPPASVTSATPISSVIYGGLQTGYTIYDYGNGNTGLDSSCGAAFYESPLTSSSRPMNVNAGSVSLNGINLPYESSSAFYGSSTPSMNLKHLTWAATGSGTVTPFTYSIIPVYPYVIDGTHSLPDTCIQSNGTVISLTGITNTNSISTIIMKQLTATDYYQVVKTINGTSGTVTFTPVDLNVFSINQPISILMIVQHTTAINIGAISYNVITYREYVKFSYLK